MRSKTCVCTVLAGAAIFGSGMAIGQRTSASRFAKHLGPSQRTEMELIELEANIDLIQLSMPRDDGMSVPSVGFNYKKDRREASIFVSQEFTQASLDKIKKAILFKYELAYSSVKHHIPEMTEDDFVLKVLYVLGEPDHNLFAECKNRNIVFH